MDSLTQVNIDKSQVVIVFCYDSEMVEHMTWEQYLKNGNCVLLGPDWIKEKIKNV